MAVSLSLSLSSICNIENNYTSEQSIENEKKKKKKDQRNKWDVFPFNLSRV